MRRLLALFALCAATATASADGFYLTESLGGADVKDELSQYMSSATRFRLSVGVRRGRWALEGWFAANLKADRVGYAEAGRYDHQSYQPFTLSTYGLDVKYLSPVAKNLDIYLRGGLSAGTMVDGLDDHAGRGIGAGAGIQLKGKVRALGFLAWPLFFTPPLAVGPSPVPLGAPGLTVGRGDPDRDSARVDPDRICWLVVGDSRRPARDPRCCDRPGDVQPEATQR